MYKKPILAHLYELVGLGIGGFLILAGLYVISMFGDEKRAVIAGIFSIPAGIAVIIIYLGIAQIFNFIGKIAYYTEKLNQTLSTKSETDDTVLLIEKLEEQKEEQKNTNKLLEDFLKRLQ